MAQLECRACDSFVFFYITSFKQILKLRQAILFVSWIQNEMNEFRSFNGLGVLCGVFSLLCTDSEHARMTGKPHFNKGSCAHVLQADNYYFSGKP